MTAKSTVECADCGASIDKSADTPDYQAPCKACGSTKRVINISLRETCKVYDGWGMKIKNFGHKKMSFEWISKPDFSFSLKKLVHRLRVINREKDHYLEKITDYDTGEIIHQCDEPLSEHQGHGSAKQNNRNN